MFKDVKEIVNLLGTSWKVLGLDTPKPGQYYVSKDVGVHLCTSEPIKAICLIVEEVKPTNAHRPYANGKEFSLVRHKWLTMNQATICKAVSYDDCGIVVVSVHAGVEYVSYKRLLEEYKFTDGTFCGVKLK